MPEPVRLRVAVDTPAHSALGEPLDYVAAESVPVGSLVRVPLSRRVVTGIVWPQAAEGRTAKAAVSDAALRSVDAVLAAMPPLSSSWCQLVEFASRYYQRGVGEVALSVLPPELRKLDDTQIAKRIARPACGLKVSDEPSSTEGDPPQLDPAQTLVWESLHGAARSAQPPTALLHGVTGSGKTEIYLRAAADALDRGRQALLLVPEINLTPQLEAQFARRFPDRLIVSLHSGLTPSQRLRSWLAAHLGQADLVLGTRLAVFASLPRLGLIVVDEEHDPSYKQQEGARYSARDLAVYRGRLESILVVLGSATPSLESWQRAQEGRYLQLSLPARIGAGALPAVRLVDMNHQPRVRGPQAALSAPLQAAIQARIDAGEQSLIFLNRRGYAPVLHCGDCGWKSACPHCSAWRVFHKLDRTMRCHHCGLAEPVPRACPDCGNPDVAPIGRGTERLEEQLGALFLRPDGQPARILRIDADSTRRQGTLAAGLGAVHAGEIDVLVGTQMITKGHDFRRITLVAAVNPDGALFSSDFRAPERLFALLMQAAGRAGRDAAQSARSEMWVQTWHPSHALYAALRRHDFASFAADQLDERRASGLPPHSHLALLRADARSADAARAFLQAASDAGRALSGCESLSWYPPVPTPIARVADVERMQMLIESTSRSTLQAFLAKWVPALHHLRRERGGAGPILRWAIDVDPLAI